MVTMGVEWAGRPEPADADPPPGRAARRHAGPDADRALPGFRAAWEKIKVKYGYAERGGSAAQLADGSWHGAGGA
jgi:hypothetical protein